MNTITNSTDSTTNVSNTAGEVTRTVTLTDRRPVVIKDSEWPKIASARGDSYGGSDYGRRQQALSHNEVDKYFVHVRQHADGRTLVYGILTSADAAWGAPSRGVDWRGGYLLAKDGDVVAAIKRIGTESGIPAYVIRECIADLPAEEI